MQLQKLLSFVIIKYSSCSIQPIQKIKTRNNEEQQQSSFINQVIYSTSYNKKNMNKTFYGVASMPKSHRSQIMPTADVPGPGSYDFNKEKAHNQLPKWSLKKRLEHGSCFENLSITPGPGGYEPHPPPKKHKESRNPSKGQKYRHFMEKTYSHSPLNLPGSINLKGGYSFGYREPFRELDRSPGPIYHLDRIKEEERGQKVEQSHRGFGFGDKDNIYKRDEDTPGPGSFDAQAMLNRNKTCENWSFGIGKRSNQQSLNPLGPGEYDPKVQTSSRTFKLRGKNQPKIIIDNVTGPGSYDIPDTKTKVGTRFNSPKTQQNDDKVEQPSNPLSPFTYNPPRYLDRPNGLGFSLGHKLPSSHERTQLPGPGAYEVRKDLAEGAGGYMGRKLEERLKETAMDNFYKYSPKPSAVAREGPKFTFPQGRRANDKDSARSAYSQEFYQSMDLKSSSCSYSMGTSKRFPVLKKEAGPFKTLPADYSTIGNMPSYLRKDSKKKL